jgi:DNA/RNA endonuclease YhcR with UshA esterase domain
VLQGEITSISTPYPGLTLLALQDSAGEITINYDDAIQDLTGSVAEIEAGQFAMVTGTVSLYKGTPQVTLTNSKELSLLPVPPDPGPEMRQLSHITLTDLGSQVLVQGRVVAMEGIKGGLKALLDDGTAQIAVVLWEQVYSSLDQPTDLDLGADITISGEVSAYEGEIEIIPRKVSDIIIESPSTRIPWVSVNEITRDDVGRVLQVRGLLGAPEGFSAGVKFPLKDGSGRITVILWSNIYQELKPRPAEDMLTQVTGLIDIYNGKLEIIPRSIYDVVNIDQGE